MDYLSYLILVALTTLVFFKNYLRSAYLAVSVKGPTALPILGNVLLLKDSPTLEKLGTNASQWFGPYFRVWVSIVPILFIYEPRHLKIILGSTKNSRKNMFYKIMHNFLGEGLITNDGYKWKKNRKLIQPYFHINVLERYIKVFTENAKECVTNLGEHTNINITSFVNHCVVQILHAAILGIPVDKESPYRKGEVTLTERLTKPWLIWETLFRHTDKAEKEVTQKLSLHNYTKKVLLKRKSAECEKVNPCLLDYFIEINKNSPEFTVEDIINEAVTFMLAGQDSVGAAVAFTLFYLAKYEDIQKAVIEEIRDMEGDNLSASNLNDMRYLEQVIKESLRLAPSIPMISRVLTEDVDLDGTTFPEGMNLLISPFITHRLPHIFPDPMKFDPERFSQESFDDMHPYAFIPFSMGSRNCIGNKFAMMEMKSILFHLLKKFRLNLVPGYEELQLNYRTTLRAKGGIRLSLTLR